MKRHLPLALLVLSGGWPAVAGPGPPARALRPQCEPGSLLRKATTVYDCGLDWDGDGSLSADAGDLRACLDAARAAVRTAEDGTDNALDIKLPDGRLVFCDPDLPGGNPCPYALEPGMNLRGVKPRLQDVSQEAQDLDMRPNGGTWIDGNGAAASADGIFVGGDVRGITIEDMGFSNYGKGLVFGTAGAPGLSFSTLRNLTFIGASSGTVSALELRNYQHVRGDHISVFRCDRCVRLMQEHNFIQYGNSLWTDLYVYTYQFPAAAYGLTLECNWQPGGDATQQFNLNTFHRLQVNKFDDGSSGQNLFFDGEPNCIVNSMAVFDADLEGLSTKVKARNLWNSSIHLTAVTNGSDTFDLDTSVAGTLISSSSGQVAVRGTPANNVLWFGRVKSAVDPNYRGVVYNDLTGRTSFVGDRLYLDGQWSGSGAAAADTTMATLTAIIESAGTTADGPDLIAQRVTMANLLNRAGSHSDAIAVRAAVLIAGGAGTGSTSDSNHGVLGTFGVFPTGTGHEINDVSGVTGQAFGASADNTGWVARRSSAVRALSPGVPSGTVDAHAGVWIDDQRGIGASNWAVRVAPQSAGAPDAGNVELLGGGWNDGHLVIGGLHFWDDAGTPRVKSGAPASASDGVAFAGPPVASPTRDAERLEPGGARETPLALLSADEATTVARGSARLVDGTARIALGAALDPAAVPGGGLTAHLTPRGASADLYIEALDARELVVRGHDAAGTEFDYVVLGPRTARSATIVANVVEPTEAGDVVVLAPGRPGWLGLARAADDSGVFGVVADAPSESTGAGGASGDAVLGPRSHPGVSVAVSGVVGCKVDADYGAIRPGDLLVTSYTPGHARRAADPRPGTILGKALDPLEAGRGVVRVLVMLR